MVQTVEDRVSFTAAARLSPGESAESYSGKGSRANAILSRASSQHRWTVLQEFCPFPGSLEWELARRFYEERGSLVFRSASHIPFEINNDGRLSAHAAELLFQHLIEQEPDVDAEREIILLEIGPGTGLFARLLLDSFRALCERYHRDFYERLHFILADCSRRMLDDILERNVLGPHRGRCSFQVADADLLSSGDITWNGSECRGRVDGIFLNYLLDSLPAAVLDVQGGVLKELYVRTSVPTEYLEGERRPASGLSSTVALTDKHRLPDLYAQLVFEHEFRATSLSRSPLLDRAIEVASADEGQVVVNSGAIRCVAACLDLLSPRGVVLINDYTHSDAAVDAGCPHQRFLGATAIPLNLPLLEDYLASIAHVQCISPLNEDERISVRLVSRNVGEATVDYFRQAFDRARYVWLQEPIWKAREEAKLGSLPAAMRHYHEAIRRQPGNWLVMGEVSSWLVSQIGDYAAGAEMAAAALELNQSCSAELWNTLGEARLYLADTNASRDAFRRAIEIDATNVRARYGMSCVCCKLGNFRDALRLLADALYHDRDGDHREWILNKQREVLLRLQPPNCRRQTP